mgnify:CR=1 FL=1
MLLEKTLKADDIATLKLISGEEIVAKVTSIDDKAVTITKPLLVNIAMDPATNRVGLQMVPGFIFTGKPDAKLTIDHKNIMVALPTDDNIKKSYISNTTSLAVPGAGAIPSNFKI